MNCATCESSMPMSDNHWAGGCKQFSKLREKILGSLVKTFWMSAPDKPNSESHASVGLMRESTSQES
eukprot:CAMPEP_0177319474 /NCGR_PEP_ID=MMETSP0368-20130122/14628_1 /TAXON_ID=447022 ORGANISM="Scrippsiella hangoei-like, Strain SHHI-4" /NCGR_SAMPLE_ID=MMETSP0368 /ASSEMBLY_ACC=CAM_ASM_000363 /LENGTH=66 /DNA_ID=CAMNT_0018778975 /DNA_START=350 /DNA_END=550 /DNA_ORIENTATION=-